MLFYSSCLTISFGSTLRLLNVKLFCFLLLGKQQYRAIYPNIHVHVIIHADNGYHKPDIPLKEILLALAYMHFLYVESFDYN